MTSAITASTLSPAPIVEVVEADRIEAAAEVAQVGEQAHRALRPVAGALLDQSPGGLGQRDVGVPEVVGAAEPHRRRAPRRVEGMAVEQVRELVEIEQGHEDPVAERVLDRLRSAGDEPSPRRSPSCSRSDLQRLELRAARDSFRVSGSQARSALHTPSS